MMNERLIKSDVTGDHAGEINAVSRGKGTKNMFDSLSKQAREMLNFNVRKFDGRVGSEAEAWLKDIREWLRIEDRSLVDALDLLLTDAAAILWNAEKPTKTSDELAKEWFIETFTVRKTITNKIVELAEAHQGTDERFPVFEIRIRKLVKDIFNSDMSEEQIIRDIIAHRARDDRIKEVFMSGKTTSFEDAREMAKIQEKIEIANNNRQNIVAIQRESYASAASRTNRPMTYPQDNKKKFLNSAHQQKEARYDMNEGRTNSNNRFIPIMEEYNRGNDSRSEWNNGPASERRMPSVSLKNIARKMFNDSRGVETNRIERLTPGQCFCCGEKGHRRFECPMRNRCLICGKEGHSFRDCFLLKNDRGYKKRVSCIYEEVRDEDVDDTREDGHSNYEENIQKSIERQKNKNDPIAFISSVGSTQ